MIRLTVCFLVLCLSSAPALAAEDDPTQLKVAVPDADQQEESLRLVKSIFEKDYRAAKSDKQKQVLAAKMLDLSEKTEQDLPAKFILLRVARDISIEIGDLELAQNSVNELDRHFSIDVLDTKLSTLGGLLKSIRGRDTIKSLFDSLVSLVDELTSDDRFGEALEACDYANTAASQLPNANFAIVISERKKRIEFLKKQLPPVKLASEKLSLEPSDPGANLVLGKYTCFGKGEWGDGLKMLAKGSDAKLKQVAQLELSAESTESALALGDTWWEIGEQLSPVEANHVRSRAAHWYRVALNNNLTGIHRVRVEQRIGQDTDNEHNGPSQASEALEPSFALAFDGRASYVRIPSYKYDGKYPVTVEAIVKVDELPKADETICGSQDAAGFGLFRARAGFWAFAVYARSGGYRFSQSNERAQLGEWTHVAGVYDGERVYLYIDGRLQVSSQKVPGGHKASRLPVHIGVNPSPGSKPSEFFHGQIKEFRISSNVRYRRHFTVPKHFDADPSTVVLYKFDEANGNVATDLSGLNHRGEIVSAQWARAE